MKERPILFSAPMVLAMLAGTKTQTRRAVKPQPADDMRPHVFPNPDVQGWVSSLRHKHGSQTHHICPYGQSGDRLWVRETFALPEAGQSAIKRLGRSVIAYRADEGVKHGKLGQYAGKWKPSIFMPRWASRLTLEIARVRVERLCAISEDDAKAEGSPGYEEGVDEPPPNTDFEWSYRASYRRVWESINGPGSWKTNPWVWAIPFTMEGSHGK